MWDVLWAYYLCFDNRILIPYKKIGLFITRYYPLTSSWIVSMTTLNTWVLAIQGISAFLLCKRQYEFKRITFDLKMSDPKNGSCSYRLMSKICSACCHMPWWHSSLVLTTDGKKLMNLWAGKGEEGGGVLQLLDRKLDPGPQKLRFLKA